MFSVGLSSTLKFTILWTEKLEKSYAELMKSLGLKKTTKMLDKVKTLFGAPEPFQAKGA